MALGNTTCILVLISTMMGYGIIALPCAVSRVGWVCGAILLILSGVLSFISIYLLFEASSTALQNSSRKEGITFFQLFESISPILGDLCNLSLTIFIYLATITYHKSMCDFGSSVLQQFNMKISSPFIIAIPIAVIEMGLALFQDLSVLSKVTYLSVTACLLVGLLCVRFSILKPKNLKFEAININGISHSMGSFIFSLCGQPAVPEIFSSMNKSASPLFISATAIAGGISLCLLMGLAGYFTGGSELKNKENILDYFYETTTPLRKSIKQSSFDPNGYSIAVATILYFLLLMCTYALLMFSAKRCLFDSLNRHITKYTLNSYNYRLGLIIVSFIWISSTTIISTLFYPQKLLNFNGTYLGNIISFILPAIAYIAHCGKKNKLKFILSLIILIFSILSISYSTYESFV